MAAKSRSTQSEDYDEAAELQQIYHDLEGVLRLGQIQTELLKSVQTRIGAIANGIRKRVK